MWQFNTLKKIITYDHVIFICLFIQQIEQETKNQYIKN
jgi:hypothetical protein